MAATITAPAIAHDQPTGWIISTRDDLLWFIGSGALGYAVLLLYFFGVPLGFILPAWVLIDRSHVFCTATRTYLDRRERSRRMWQLLAIVPITGVCILAWAAGLNLWVVYGANTYAVWHISKQHFGLVMIYKRKAGERGGVRLDKLFLLISLVLPCGVYLLGKLPGTEALHLNAVAFSGYFVFASFYAAKQFRKVRHGEPVSKQKLLLMAGFIPLAWLAFLFVAPAAEGVIYATIAFNIGHSLQYHRLMWFHNSNHYRNEDVAADAGIAASIAQRWPYYVAAAIVLYLVVQELSKLLIGDPALLQVILFVPLICHYYLDGHIWRVRGDKDLAAALRLST